MSLYLSQRLYSAQHYKLFNTNIQILVYGMLSKRLWESSHKEEKPNKAKTDNKSTKILYLEMGLVISFTASIILRYLNYRVPKRPCRVDVEIHFS